MFLVDDKMITNPHMPTAVDFHNILVNYVEIASEDLEPGAAARRSSAAAETKRDSGTIPIRPDSVPEQDESASSGDEEPEPEDIEAGPEEAPPGDFRQLIPQALLDMDLDEDDPRYQIACNIMGDGSGPPGLPMFLNRSLLNGVTQVKDDSSVLVLPNHTVLNHLMTSSVKNGVLATSVTTRYKKKVSLPFLPLNCPGLCFVYGFGVCGFLLTRIL
jgi:hypothetical protein